MNRTFIKRMREKPKEARVEFAFLSALATTGVVALLWVALLPMRLDGVNTDGAELAGEEGTFGSFFSNARANLGQLIGAESQDESEEGNYTEGSVSGTYEEGRPDDYKSGPVYTPKKEDGLAIPVSRREVRIGTSSRPE